jgi:hypothetical protein
MFYNMIILYPFSGGKELLLLPSYFLIAITQFHVNDYFNSTQLLKSGIFLKQ